MKRSPKPKKGYITTPAALRFAGINLDRWQHIVPMFKGAPPTTAGKVRYFDTDDCVCLYLIDHLLEAGVPCERVGEIATEARQVLAGSDVDTLWVELASDVPIRVSSTEPTDKPRLAFPISVIRAEVEQFAAQLQ